MILRDVTKNPITEGNIIFQREEGGHRSDNANRRRNLSAMTTHVGPSSHPASQQAIPYYSEHRQPVSGNQ